MLRAPGLFLETRPAQSQVLLRKGCALASRAWAEQRTSERVWQPRGPKLCGPRVSSEAGRCRASCSDRLPGLLAPQPLSAPHQLLLWSRARSGGPSPSPSYFHCLSLMLSLSSFSPISLPFFTKAGSEDLGEATACGVANGLFLGSFPLGREQQPLQGSGVGVTTQQEPVEAAPCHGARENSALELSKRQYVQGQVDAARGLAPPLAPWGVAAVPLAPLESEAHSERPLGGSEDPWGWGLSECVCSLGTLHAADSNWDTTLARSTT